MSRILGVLVLFSVATLLGSGCASIRDEQVVYKTDKRYPPYKGDVKVFWKEHGVPANPNSYVLIGTVSAIPFWAGVHDGKTYPPLHKHIVDTAAEMGGNAVIIYCGEIGTVAQAKCYGDVLRMR